MCRLVRAVTVAGRSSGHCGDRRHWLCVSDGGVSERLTDGAPGPADWRHLLGQDCRWVRSPVHRAAPGRQMTSAHQLTSPLSAGVELRLRLISNGASRLAE